MMTDFQKHKILSVIAFFATNFKISGLTKLYKFMSFADFNCIKRTGKSITGLDYKAYQYGPFPEDLNEEIYSKDSFFGTNVFLENPTGAKIKLVRVRGSFQEKYFSKIEVQVLKDMLFIFQDTKTQDMVFASHERNSPWKKTVDTKGERAIIDPRLALDGSKGCISADEFERFLEESKEFKQLIYG